MTQTLRSGLATAAAAFAVLLAAAAALPAQPVGVRGRILLTPGSAPLAGARAELFAAVDPYASALRRLETGAEDTPLASAAAGPAGAFRLAAPAPDCYRLVVRAEGYVPVQRLLSPLVEPEVLPPARPRKASPLRVTVLGPDGRPAPGIDLHAFAESPGWEEEPGQAPDWWPVTRRATTGPDGTAVLPRGAGERLSLIVTSPRFLGHTAERIDTDRATLRLTARGTVRLQVRDARGQPAARALARLGFSPWALLGAADAGGRLDVAVFPEAPLQIVVEDPTGGLAEVALPTEAGRAEVLRVELRPHEILAGKAVDARTRAPLPGAVVWSEAFPSDPSVRAGADGGFQLPVHRSLRLAVLAGAAGHLPVHVEMGATGAASAVATLLLPPAAEIAGVVVDAQGKPVARAGIQGHPTRWDPMAAGPAAASTGPDGHFRLPRLAAGVTYRLQVTREGFSPGSALAEPTPPGKGSLLRIVLAAGRTASGRVTDPEGRPVPKAELTLFGGGAPWGSASAGRQRPWRATSDESGAFELRDLAAGTYRLQARAPGFALLEKTGIEVPATGGTADLGVLVLTPGAAIEGRVVSSRNQPVEGASVRTMNRRHGPDFGGGDVPTEGATAADGSFRLAGLPPGEQVELIVVHPAYPPVRVPGVEVPPPEPLVIELREGGALAGRVVGADGQPVEGATLIRYETTSMTVGGAQSSHGTSSGIGTTDARGRFHVANLALGLIEIEVAAPGWTPAWLRGLAIPAGGTLDVGDVVLQRGAVLEGAVRDGDGNPAAGLHVSLWREPGDGQPHHGRGEPLRTDAEGRFRAEGLTPGRYQVSAHGPDQEHAEAAVQVQPGTNRAELAFPRGVEVAGSVVDEQGAAVPEASVRLHPVGIGHQVHTESRTDGTFRFPRVRPGEYRVRATRRGYAAGEAGPIAVAELAVAGVEVRLAAEEDSGPALRGRFLGLPAREQMEVRIRARSRSAPGFAHGSPDGRGGYAVEDLEPGDWEIDAVSASGRQAGGRVLIEPGAGTAVLDLDFGDGGVTLSGSVTTGGQPLAGARVTLAGGEPGEPGPKRRTTSVRYDGRFEIAGLAPGHYTLLVALPGTGLGTVRRIVLAEDFDVAIEIETGGFRGRLTSAATGEPVAGALIRLTLHHERWQTGFAGPLVRTDEAGGFEVAGLGVGGYRLAIEAEGYVPSEASAEVGHGTPPLITIRIEPR